MQTIEQEIRQFIRDNFLFGELDGNLSNDDSLLDRGIIDSTGVLELVTFLELDFGHSGIDPLQTRREWAGAVRKFGEVWWGGRHHEMNQPPMSLRLSPHLAAVFLLSGCGEKGQSRVEDKYEMKIQDDELVPKSRFCQRSGPVRPPQSAKLTCPE